MFVQAWHVEWKFLHDLEARDERSQDYCGPSLLVLQEMLVSTSSS